MNRRNDNGITYIHTLKGEAREGIEDTGIRKAAAALMFSLLLILSLYPFFTVK
jgi:hypothetical protein